MEPREVVDQELSIISATFAVQKAIEPMAVLIKDDRRFGVNAYYENDAHKEIVSQGIKDLVKRSDPDIVIYMAEAYTKVIKGKRGVIPARISPSDLEAIEVVTVQIEFKTGEKYGCDARIKRDRGVVRLERFEVHDASMAFGRFMDFFPIGRTN
jgi:hypothetical protein